MTPNILELRGHHFCDDLIGDSAAILDLGGHKGEFSEEINRRHPGLKSLIVEANPDLYEALKPPAGSEKIWGAASGSDGEATFFASNSNPEGGNIYSEEGTQFKLNTYGLETLVRKLGADQIDLAKVDIEGAELELLEEASDDLLKRFRQFTIEFHDFLHPDHLPRIDKLFRRMETLGFLVIKCSMKHHRDVLIVRLSDLGQKGISPEKLTKVCRRKAFLRALSHNIRRKLNLPID
jgi:FkbM family methyltransferase